MSGCVFCGIAAGAEPAEVVREWADAIAVVAVARPGHGALVSWSGDCRGYGFDGQRLRQYTTDQTVGEQLRRNGAPLAVAADHDNWLHASLREAVVASIYEVEIPPGELVLLVSDGAVAGVEHGVLESVAAERAGDPAGLAGAVVELPEAEGSGYRDDATAVVLGAGW